MSTFRAHQPLSAILSAEQATDKQEASGKKFRPSRSRSPDQSLASGTLRDRLACTRLLSKSLRKECLERLDQIAVPHEICRRKSWTHLEDMSKGSPEGVESTERLSGVSASQPGSPTSLSGEVEQSSGEHRHIEVVVKITDERAYQPALSNSLTRVLAAEEEVDPERLAAINFLRDFHATPAPVHELDIKDTLQEPPPLLGKRRQRSRKEIHSDLQKEPQYLKLYQSPAEDRELGAAGSVWKSTAKGAARAALVDKRAASSSPTAVSRRPRGSVSQSASYTDLRKHNTQLTRRAIEAARGESHTLSPDDDTSHVSRDMMECDSGIARGASSLLRTSLRYVLQV